MRNSLFPRLLATCIGLLVVSIAYALPPAPPGPYQSIEDALIRAEGASQPSVSDRQLTPTAREIARERAIGEQARDWNWGSVPSGNPVLKRQGNEYPPAGGASNYPYRPNVAPR